MNDQRTCAQGCDLVGGGIEEAAPEGDAGGELQGKRHVAAPVSDEFSNETGARGFPHAPEQQSGDEDHCQDWISSS